MGSAEAGREFSSWSRKPLIIGISGATNAGKTTVTQRIVEEYPGTLVVHQDSFFRDVDDPKHEHVQELGHHNWDTFSAINFDLLMEDIRAKLAQLETYNLPSSGFSEDDLPRILIIEGILVLNVPEIADLMDRKFYLTLPKDECLRRRLTRSYDPPDVPGYFDQIVWPMYQKHSSQVKKNNKDVCFIDATSSHEKVANVILQEIQRSTRDRVE